MPETTMTIQDLSFTDYQQRQYEEIKPEKILERAMAARPSGNFRYTGQKWVPQEYPGFAIVSMVDDNPGNELLPFQLTALQDELRSSLHAGDAYYMLPPSSFHQTVANTLSAERFHKNIVDRGLEGSYPELVGKTFAGLPAAAARAREPLRMELIGLSIFGTSLGLLGAFGQASDYERVTGFRTGFYGDRSLQGLDIRMTRPFIGHITLAYIEQDLDPVRREWLAAVVNALNAKIARKSYRFLLSHTGLRRYSHLAEFRKLSSYPDHIL